MKGSKFLIDKELIYTSMLAHGKYKKLNANSLILLPIEKKS